MKYKDMIFFKDIDEFVSYIGKMSDGNIVNVVANKDFIVATMKKLMCVYDDIIIDYCDIEFDFDYDKEYMLGLSNDEDDEFKHLTVEKAYNEYHDKYFSADGYFLFHEDTSSRAMTDIVVDGFGEVYDYDCFAIGEEENEDKPICRKCEGACSIDVDDCYDEDDDIHGFEISKRTDNGYCSYSYYCTDAIDKDDIDTLIKLIKNR